MRTWKEEEAVPPHWTVSVDDERIVEIFAAHTGAHRGGRALGGDLRLVAGGGGKVAP